jgi:hypothetical protein
MPFLRERYPSNWEEISQRIRFERAQGKCEECGAPHGEWIVRRRINPSEWRLACSLAADEDKRLWLPPVKVVLTTHHVGVAKPDGTPGDRHDKMDCRDENLAALCQRCHWIADWDIHYANKVEAQRTRKLNAGQMELFEGGHHE